LRITVSNVNNCTFVHTLTYAADLMLNGFFTYEKLVSEGC